MYIETSIVRKMSARYSSSSASLGLFTLSSYVGTKDCLITQTHTTSSSLSFHLRAESFTDANRSSDQALSSQISIVRVTSPPTTNSSGSTMSNTSFSDPKSALIPLFLMTFAGDAQNRRTFHTSTESHAGECMMCLLNLFSGKNRLTLSEIFVRRGEKTWSHHMEYAGRSIVEKSELFKVTIERGVLPHTQKSEHVVYLQLD